MLTLILFTSLFDGKRSLDGKLLLTLACPFSSLRLLEENTREPISGEKTRAQQSIAREERGEFIAPSPPPDTRQGYLPLEEEAAEESTEAGAEDEPAPHPVWELF